jgi:hypothetical protein
VIVRLRLSPGIDQLSELLGKLAGIADGDLSTKEDQQ